MPNRSIRDEMQNIRPQMPRPAPMGMRRPTPVIGGPVVPGAPVPRGGPMRRPMPVQGRPMMGGPTGRQTLAPGVGAAPVVPPQGQGPITGAPLAQPGPVMVPPAVPGTGPMESPMPVRPMGGLPR